MSIEQLLGNEIAPDLREQLDIAYRAISVAHRMLAEISETLESRSGGRGSCRRGLQVSREKVGTSAARLTNDLLTSFQEGLLTPDGNVMDKWKDLILERIRGRVERAGRPGAAILFRLMQEPDIFVPQEELVRAAGLCSNDGRAIKVYIHHLRRTFENHGYAVSAIETGRALIELLTN